MLGAELFDVDAEQMLEAVRILRQVPEDKVPEVLESVAVRFWRNGLRERKSAELEKLAGRN